jgi:hypothetical protein
MGSECCDDVGDVECAGSDGDFPCGEAALECGGSDTALAHGGAALAAGAMGHRRSARRKPNRSARMESGVVGAALQDARRRRHTGTRRRRAENEGVRSFCASFLGRPRGRKDDSKPRRFAVRPCHVASPYGEPLLTLCRNASNSSAVSARFNPASHSRGGLLGQSSGIRRKAVPPPSGPAAPDKRFPTPFLPKICAYLRNLEKRGGADAHADGILLYPAVSQRLDLRYRVHGHVVRVCTLDLAQEWKMIRRDLLDVVLAA